MAHKSVATVLINSGILGGLLISGCVTEVRPVSSQQQQQQQVRYTDSGGRRTDQQFDPSTINWQPAFSAEQHAREQQQRQQDRRAPRATEDRTASAGGEVQTDQWGDAVDPNADIPLYDDGRSTPTGKSEYELNTSYVAAGVAPLGSVAWNGRSVPLARPSGGYVAVQSGAVTPWNIALAKPNAGGLPPTSIHIYQIVSQELSDRPVLYQKHWLEDVGILGRGADDWGFLIEAPRPDGSRWIGKVSWESGDIAWLVKDQYVNAFASMAPDGRLVWSRRAVNSPNFELAVEMPDGTVATAPHNGGMWLMPSWSCSGNLIFAFYLAPNSELGVVALDSTRGPDRLGAPLGSRLLIDNGVPGDAYDAAIGIPYPTAPDGSPRFLFYHPGLAFRRMCMFDPFVDGITYYKALTGAGGWYNESVVLVCSSNHMYLQRADAATAPTELMTGPYLAIPTSPPDQPYLLLAPNPDRSDRAMLLLMQLVDSGRVEQHGTVSPR